MSCNPKNNYRILMYVFSSFQWYITCLSMKKLIFCHFSSTSFKNGFKMTLKPKNNYIFLKHKLSAFQWYITCHDIRKLIFCHFLMYASFKNGSKSGLVVQRVQKSVKNRFSNRFPIVCVLGGWWLIFRGGESSLDYWILIGGVKPLIYPC